MSLTSLLKQVDKLKAEFEALQPLKKEDEERLWKKFRLDWNYNSNHIEGNTLTYGETELLLIFGKTTGDHTIREYEEMQAHDVAIKLVQEEAVEKEKPLTEQFIRLLNEKLLVKPFWKEARTVDGQDTRREIIPGQYKQFPNSVRLENGDMFHYANPQEVPILMGDLVADYNKAVEEGKHPIDIAAMLHYRFVRIHPFDDGNGRVARLLMNYVLLRNGYLPAIIKTEQKKEYLNALNKTDVLNAEVASISNVAPFAEYIAEQLEWSFNIAIRIAKGEIVVERGDFKKSYNNLLVRLKDKRNIVFVKDEKGVDYFFNNIFKKFIIDFYDFSEDLRRLFLSFKYDILIIDHIGNKREIFWKNFNIIKSKIDSENINNENTEEEKIEIFNRSYFKLIKLSDWQSVRPQLIHAISLSVVFVNFSKDTGDIFNVNCSFDFVLEMSYYLLNVKIEDQNFSIKKYYDEDLSADNIESILIGIAEIVQSKI